jgi:hypothetical protein
MKLRLYPRSSPLGSPEVATVTWTDPSAPPEVSCEDPELSFRILAYFSLPATGSRVGPDGEDYAMELQPGSEAWLQSRLMTLHQLDLRARLERT